MVFLLYSIPLHEAITQDYFLTEASIMFFFNKTSGLFLKSFTLFSIFKNKMKIVKIPTIKLKSYSTFLAKLEVEYFSLYSSHLDDKTGFSKDVNPLLGLPVK